MPLWRRRSTPATSLDEFVKGGADRAADPIDLAVAAKRWEQKVGAVRRSGPSPLGISAFSLIRGGDRFERTSKPPRTEAELLARYADEQLDLQTNRVPADVADAAIAGVLRVLAGHPAVIARMLVAKPIRIVLIPEGDDFRRFGFPRHTNPNAAGIFWNAPKDPIAMIGLREEHVRRRPHLMVHEMTHAVHLLGLTARERDDIDQFLLPVYRNRRWVEEAVAIYAERAFGAQYGEDDLNAPGLYGKTRRDWRPDHVFSRFVADWLRPE